MKITARSAVTVALFNLTALSPFGQAGCKSDCRDDYESEIDSCHELYGDADDADDLQRCVQDAKDDFRSVHRRMR